MALPTTDPKDTPTLNSKSPATAYVTKDNILLPKQAQAEGVAVRADTDIEDQLPASATVAALPTPPSE